MKLWLCLLAMTLLALPGPAVADGSGVNPSGNGLLVHTTETLDVPAAPGFHPTFDFAPVIDVGTELQEAFCGGVNWTQSCAAGEAGPVAGPGPELAPPFGVLVSQAFAFVPLPASGLVIEPPGGRTLVNLETNFYTDAPVERVVVVVVLGRVVELRVWPVEFRWRFGDGATLVGGERGAAYPDLQITHRYLARGLVAPSLDTTYAARWRLRGASGWRPVDGTVTINGSPSSLLVVSATPTLVASQQ